MPMSESLQMKRDGRERVCVLWCAYMSLALKPQGMLGATVHHSSVQLPRGATSTGSLNKRVLQGIVLNVIATTPSIIRLAGCHNGDPALWLHLWGA